MDESTHRGITRRQVLQAGGATFAGYAVGVEKALAQAITTDTTGISAGEFEVNIGVTTCPSTRRGRPPAAPRRSSCASPRSGASRVGPRLHAPLREGGLLRRRARALQARGGVGHIAMSRTSSRSCSRCRRKQCSATSRRRWTGRRSARGRAPTAWASRAGRWGGSTVYQVAATNPDIKAAVAWVRAARPALSQTPNPVTGFDVAKDIKMPFLGLYGETDRAPSRRT